MTRIYADEMTMRDVAEAVEAQLKEAGLWEELDYFSVDLKLQKKKDEAFPEYAWIACFPVTGGNEGHYIHIDIITRDNEHIHFLTAKTFMGMEYAGKVATECAKLLS